jgi:FkbM family methyltransferase
VPSRPPYPAWLRSAFGRVAIPLDIDQRRSRLVADLLDRAFSRPAEAGVRLGGADLRLDLGNPSERLLFYAPANVLRSYRGAELHGLMLELPDVRGRIFVDIGANLGLFSLLARSRGMETLMFEPEPAHYRFLRRNEQVLGRAVGWALSDEDGRATLQVASRQNPGASSLVPSSAGAGLSRSSVVVETTTFDAALRRLEVDPAQIALVKVDVEGNEERTIRGMRTFLTEHSTPVWCEVRGPSSDRAPNSHERVAELLGELGYRAYSKRRGKTTPFRPGPSLPQVFDLLFLKR